jgi:hypothetical protein
METAMSELGERALVAELLPDNRGRWNASS